MKLKGNKYRNTKVVVDGITFDSKSEAARWPVLLEEQRQGLIQDLRRQHSIPVVLGGKLVFRYRADYSYVRNGRRVIEDCKSSFTRMLPEYRLKKKILAAHLGVEIVEIIKK